MPRASRSAPVPFEQDSQHATNLVEQRRRIAQGSVLVRRYQRCCFAPDDVDMIVWQADLQRSDRSISRRYILAAEHWRGMSAAVRDSYHASVVIMLLAEISRAAANPYEPGTVRVNGQRDVALTNVTVNGTVYTADGEECTCYACTEGREAPLDEPRRWPAAASAAADTFRRLTSRFAETSANFVEITLDNASTAADTRSTSTADQQEEAMPAQPRRRQRPEDRVAYGNTERRCRVCRTWYLLHENNYRYDSRQYTYRTECVACERRAQRERAARRRAQGTTGTSRTQRRTDGRAFGVEIELTGPSADLIVEAMAAIGHRPTVRGYAATNGNRWELKEDGSVSGEGLELVSPKLYGQAGLTELKNVLQAVRSVGGTVDRSCGIHVHVDFRGKSLQQIKDSILPIVKAQDTFWKFVAPSRRRNSYCDPWRNYQIEELEALTSLQYFGNVGPRGNVNAWSYPRHGSIEFRSHGASLRYDRISAWVKMLLAACERGEQTGGSDFPADSSALLAQLVGRQGFTSEDAYVMYRFEAAAERAAREAEDRVESDDLVVAS